MAAMDVPESIVNNLLLTLSFVDAHRLFRSCRRGGAWLVPPPTAEEKMRFSSVLASAVHRRASPSSDKEKGQENGKDIQPAPAPQVEPLLRETDGDPGEGRGTRPPGEPGEGADAGGAAEGSDSDVEEVLSRGALARKAEEDEANRLAARRRREEEAQAEKERAEAQQFFAGDGASADAGEEEEEAGASE